MLREKTNGWDVSTKTIFRCIFWYKCKILTILRRALPHFFGGLRFTAHMFSNSLLRTRSVEPVDPDKKAICLSTLTGIVTLYITHPMCHTAKKPHSLPTPMLTKQRFHLPKWCHMEDMHLTKVRQHRQHLQQPNIAVQIRTSSGVDKSEISTQHSISGAKLDSADKMPFPNTVQFFPGKLHKTLQRITELLDSSCIKLKDLQERNMNMKQYHTQPPIYPNGQNFISSVYITHVAKLVS